jgi:hypothetical protein
LCGAEGFCIVARAQGVTGDRANQRFGAGIKGEHAILREEGERA